MTTASQFLESMRARGFRLRAEAGRLVVGPASGLAAGDAEALRAHKAELLALLDPEEQEWAKLTAWFLEVDVPATPYRLNRAVRVDEPAKSHAWLRREIAAGPRGQVRRGILARLRRLKEIFGGT